MNLVDLRLILEPGIAELAAYNATDEEIEHLKDLCDTVEYKIEHDLYYIQDDIDFHTYIARCSKNKVVEQIISIIETADHLLPQLWENFAGDHHHPPRHHKIHRRARPRRGAQRHDDAHFL